MIKNYIENANFEDTGFSYTRSLISGKHKMVILYCLMEFEVVRFNELKRYLRTISDKTLSTNLKELEADHLIVRREYPQIPPKVEYSLSDRGKSLMAVLDQLCVWGEKIDWSSGKQIPVCRTKMCPELGHISFTLLAHKSQDSAVFHCWHRGGKSTGSIDPVPLG